MPPNAVEISGSPRIASTAAKRTLDGFQPIVLKASTTPTDCEPVDIALSVCAVIAEVVGGRDGDVAGERRASAWSTSAAAPLRTRLVAIAPPAASDVPWPVNVEPPEEEPVTSVIASIVAASVALTVSAPAVTLRFFSVALDVAADVVEDDRAADPDRRRLREVDRPAARAAVPSTGFHRPRSV